MSKKLSRRNTILAAAGVVGGNALAGGQPAAQGAVAAGQSMSQDRLAWLVDRAEIEDLIKRLTFALDDRDWKTAADCFVPDTEIVVGGAAIRGAAAFVEAAQSAVSDISRTQHAPMTILIEIESRDRAKVRTQLLGVHDVTPPDGLARIVTGQRYVYRVIRQMGSWKISEIDNETIWMDGDPQGRAAARNNRKR